MKVVYTLNEEKSLFYYKKNFLDQYEYKIIKDWLESKKFCDGFCVSGKKIPRQQLWYQENGEYFCKKWINKYERWESNPYEEDLLNIQKKIQDFANNLHTIENDILIQVPHLNSCLINKYRDGKDSIKPHRDTCDSFGYYPTVLGLSIGEERTISIKKINYDPMNINSLKHDSNTDLNLDIKLEDNSLFIMAGASQKYFTHEIPKYSNNNVRYSLTFREYI